MRPTYLSAGIVFTIVHAFILWLPVYYVRRYGKRRRQWRVVDLIVILFVMSMIYGLIMFVIGSNSTETFFDLQILPAYGTYFLVIAVLFVAWPFFVVYNNKNANAATWSIIRDSVLPIFMSIFIVISLVFGLWTNGFQR